MGGKLLQRAVVKEVAFVDEEDAGAEGDDVGHVVAGEEDGDVVALVVGGDELAQAALHGDVEAESGLVEEEEAGAVEEAGDELALHALAEGEVAHLAAEEGFHAEQGDELVDGGLKIGRGHVVDGGEYAPAIERGDVPAELAAVAGDHGKLAQVGGAALGGGEAGDLDVTGGGMEEAGEELEGGGLAGAVGAEDGDHLAGLDGEGDVTKGSDGAEAAAAEAAQGSAEARIALGDVEVLAELRDGNERHGVLQGDVSANIIKPWWILGGLWRVDIRFRLTL
jgi:hypothetical protein